MATAPTITSNGGGDAATVLVPENSIPVGIVTAFDPDPGANLTFSLIDGEDRFRFSINAATGALIFFDSIYTDFESPNDAGHDGSYQVVVRVSDGSLTDTQSVTVTLGDVNEVPKFQIAGSVRSIIWK
jgi:hypothetical protein